MSDQATNTTPSMKTIKPIDWAELTDPMDEVMYNVTISNLWKPSRHKVADDLRGWRSMTAAQRLCIMRIFAGLTCLDTWQAQYGLAALESLATSQHEEHNYSLIKAVEVIHAQSYSYIFTSLAVSKEDKDNALLFASTHPTMARKADILQDGYASGDHLKMQITSVLLESFAFFSGFFYPLYLASSEDKLLIETGVIISAICRDEATHGYYIGWKFQQAVKKLSEEQQQYYKDWTITQFMRLYEVECEYTELLYADVGMTDKVKKFLGYTGNKAVQNLGYPELFPAEMCDADETVIAATGSGGHEDFFAQTSAKYKLADYEPTPDEEWAVNPKPGLQITGNQREHAYVETGRVAQGSGNSDPSVVRDLLPPDHASLREAGEKEWHPL